MSRSLQLGGLGALLLLLTAAGLWLHLPYADKALSPAQKEAAVIVIGLAGLAYLVAVHVVLQLQLSSRLGTWLVFVVAIAMRLAFLFGHPVLSSDVYRYVWDGQVQKAGINPYRYIPADPALKTLRDNDVFPRINRADYAHTIYPPAAQIIFAGVGRVTHNVTGMKVAMVVFELIACLCLLQLLKMLQMPADRLLIYAWNPLAQWSFAFDGHIDAAVIGLLALALLYRARHRFGLAGGVLAFAALVKFLPLVVAPAFVRGGKLWRPAAIGVLIIALLYGLYSSVGLDVFGFMPGYNSEEGLFNGSGLWLLAGLKGLSDNTDLINLPDDFGKYYLVAAALVMAMLGLWIAYRRLPRGQTDVGILCRDTAILAAGTMVILSPHYPWYFPWLALPAVIAPIPAVIWLSVAPAILYLDPGNQRNLLGAFIYVPAIALAAFQLWQTNFRQSPALLPAKGSSNVRC